MTNSAVKAAIYQLAEQHQDPICAYLYDLNALADHARSMVAALPANCELFYAAKANPEAEILQVLKPIVHGFEAASGGELKWLREQLPQQKLIFGGPAKIDRELVEALKLGVELIHVESCYELRRLHNIAQQQAVNVAILLRMNIAIGDINTTQLAMGGQPTPFGFDQNQLEEALAIIVASPNLELKGFHFHLMSHQLDYKNHLRLMALYFDTFVRWQQQYNLSLTHLNVGGGIGINYLDTASPFDWISFCSALSLLIEQKAMHHCQIRFECGRAVTAACGYYCMEVLDIKQSFGETFVVARGGTHHFRTPAAQGHSHPFTVCYGETQRSTMAPQIENSRVTIVGQLCTPKDILAKRQPVERLAVGDFVVFNYAGAYAWNISHQNFLMHDKPHRLFIPAKN